jgi:hypothetical protein
MTELCYSEIAREGNEIRRTWRNGKKGKAALHVCGAGFCSFMTLWFSATAAFVAPFLGLQFGLYYGCSKLERKYKVKLKELRDNPPCDDSELLVEAVQNVDMQLPNAPPYTRLNGPIDLTTTVHRSKSCVLAP